MTTICPNAASHTPMPATYMERHEWATQMRSRRFVQAVCAGCGRWLLWRSSIARARIAPSAVGRVCMTGGRP